MTQFELYREGKKVIRGFASNRGSLLWAQASSRSFLRQTEPLTDLMEGHELSLLSQAREDILRLLESIDEQLKDAA